MEGQYIDWYSVEVASMPERVSNNAVIEGSINENPYVFAFGGIDSTKIWSGIHLRSFRYNVMADIWDTIPSLPDNMGKIAAAASNLPPPLFAPATTGDIVMSPSLIGKSKDSASCTSFPATDT